MFENIDCMIAHIFVCYFSIPVLDFPTCVVGEQSELTADALVSEILTPRL